MEVVGGGEPLEVVGGSQAGSLLQQPRVALLAMGGGACGWSERTITIRTDNATYQLA